MSAGNYMHDRPLVTTATQEDTTVHRKALLSSRVEAVGRELARYGLVVVVGWIGLMKFTAYEAEGISSYVTNSPLMSWVYGQYRSSAAAQGVASYLDRGVVNPCPIRRLR